MKPKFSEFLRLRQAKNPIKCSGAEDGSSLRLKIALIPRGGMGLLLSLEYIVSNALQCNILQFLDFLLFTLHVCLLLKNSKSLIVFLFSQKDLLYFLKILFFIVFKRPHI